MFYLYMVPALFQLAICPYSNYLIATFVIGTLETSTMSFFFLFACVNTTVNASFQSFVSLSEYNCECTISIYVLFRVYHYQVSRNELKSNIPSNSRSGLLVKTHPALLEGGWGWSSLRNSVALVNTLCIICPFLILHSNQFRGWKHLTIHELSSSHFFFQ